MNLQYLWGFIFLPILVLADIDFSKHQIENGETLFAVTHVADGDVLNVREQPTHTSAIRYKLPSDAQNIISYEKDMAAKVGKNIWVSIRVGFDDGFLDGYVNAKYLKFAEVFETIENKKLSVRVPYFMGQEITPSSWIRVFHAESINHYNGCDQRDTPELLYTLVDFEIDLTVYDTLSEALKKVLSIDSKNFTEYYDRQSDWFKPTSNDLIESINYYGLEGYRYTIGAEGCGERIYFFQRNDKVLVIKEPFDHTPPILSKGEVLPPDWKFADKAAILESIVQTIDLK